MFSNASKSAGVKRGRALMWERINSFKFRTECAAKGRVLKSIGFGFGVGLLGASIEVEFGCLWQWCFERMEAGSFQGFDNIDRLN